MNILQDRLRLTLLGANISQAQLARVSGLNTSHINAICRGRARHVTAHTVVVLARSLGCSSDWLLGLASLGPSPLQVRLAIAQAGGTVLQRIGSTQIHPINVNAGVKSLRGRVRGSPTPRAPVAADDDRTP